MKTCRGSCGRTLDFSQFYSHPRMPTGLHYCKDCVKERIRKHRFENDSVREREREKYRATPAKRAAIERYKQRNPDRNRKSKWASQIVQRALKKGILVKPAACHECGQEGYVEGAHSDYSQPLEVRWLCRRCHRRWDTAKPKLSVLSSEL